MKVQEVAKRVMKDAGMTQTDVAKKSGIAGQSSIGMFLKSKSMRVDSLLIILDACGFELVARRANGKGPEYVIDGKEGVPEEQGTVDPAMSDAIRAIVAEEIAKMSGKGM